MKRNLMKEAHKMAKKIKEQYPEVDYQAQLGLCLSFLAQEGEQEMKIEGKSEKQIKYAENCRDSRIAQFERKIGINALKNMTKAWEIINACECDIEILIYHYGQHR